MIPDPDREMAGLDEPRVVGAGTIVPGSWSSLGWFQEGAHGSLTLAGVVLANSVPQTDLDAARPG